MHVLSRHTSINGHIIEEFTALEDRDGNVVIMCNVPDKPAEQWMMIPKDAREWAASALQRAPGAVVVQFPRHRMLVDVLGPVA